MSRLPQISRSFPLVTLLLAVPLVAILAYVAYGRYGAPDDGWKTYRHEIFKYEFRYPADWTIVENREPQPGDDFLSQLVVIAPKAKAQEPNRRPAPHVMAMVNPQGDQCGAGGFNGSPIEVSGFKGVEVVCHFWLGPAGSGGPDCNPKPKCVDVPFAAARWFERGDNTKFYILVNNTLVTEFDQSAEANFVILRKILDSYRFTR